MLRIRYPGNRNTLSTLAATGFTRQNFGAPGATSSRITADTPDGVLGGMVAKFSGNYEINISDNHTAVGLFLNDAAGSPFENTPAVASGKITMMTSMGCYETDLYETRDEADQNPVTYVAGDPLYASDFGLLTSENTGSPICGIVAKAPSPTDPFLGFDSKI
jgi:hypothetical protein